MKIFVSKELPPIPVRRFDWVAGVEGQESSMFYGRTAAEALRELADWLEERDAKVSDFF